MGGETMEQKSGFPHAFACTEEARSAEKFKLV